MWPVWNAYLRGHVAGFSEISKSNIQGAASQSTFRLTADGKRYVLRRKPPGKLLPSAHAVDRE